MNPLQSTAPIYVPLYVPLYALSWSSRGRLWVCNPKGMRSTPVGEYRIKITIDKTDIWSYNCF